MYQENSVKIYAKSKLMEYAAKNVTICCVKFFWKFADSFPNISNISRSSADTLFPISRKTRVLIVIKCRITGPDRLYGNV